MKSALHAEWTKLRTIAGPAWLLLGMIAATVALSTAVTSMLTCGAAGCHEDTTKLSLTGVDLGQAFVVVLAVQVICDEHSSGMIRSTLTATPGRTTVLAAKALVVTGVVAAAGAVAVLGSLVAARLILPSHGFTPEPTPRAAARSMIYLILIALLSLGVATVVRDSATSIGTVLAVLYLFPVVAQSVGDPRWQRLLDRIAPMNASLTVLAMWSGSALMAGGFTLCLRDP